MPGADLGHNLNFFDSFLRLDAALHMNLNEEPAVPIQVTCPQCRTKLQVADADRAKQLRCPRCKTVFTARAPASNGNYSSVKPAAPSVKPAASSSAGTIRAVVHFMEAFSFEKGENTVSYFS